MTAQLTLIACLALGGDATAQDLKKMSGSWLARIEQVSGKPVPKTEQTRIRVMLTIVGESFTVFVDDKQEGSGSMKIDGTRRTGLIDLKHAFGVNRGKQQLGIYKFEGDNELRVVFGDVGEPRPTGFATRPGTKEMMLLYTRRK